jgi:peptide/nickel transport system substrate-binding protein
MLKHSRVRLLRGPLALAAATALVLALVAADRARAEEPPDLAEQVSNGALPPLEQRLPEQPLVIDLAAQGLEPGKYGGQLRTLVDRARDIRYMTVYGYARLVGYLPDLSLEPDILRAVDVEEGRIFTLHLRKGHKWSDGNPFTSEDFRYFWEEIENNEELRPAGPLAELQIDGELPQVEILDELTVRYSWSNANPTFLPMLAQARPPFIYRPSHYLKQFHVKYGDPATIQAAVARENVRNWAQLHNRYDNMYENDNVDLPTLQPWMNTSSPPAQRFVFKRNPYFHRVDSQGRQLPYIGEVAVTVADSKLIPAKAVAGETDLQTRGLSFGNIAILKQGEARSEYRTLLWPIGKSSHMALYPNLNTNDPVWRELVRNADFRRALSISIDRELINKTLFLGLARPVNNTVLPGSDLYSDANAQMWAEFDLDKANQLLDGIGLTDRDSDGFRLLPDGRRVEIVVETAGERSEEVDILQLIAETWKRIGVKLFTKPSQRDVLRERCYAGETVMAVWEGWDIGAPTPSMSPRLLAPTAQDNLAWPKWGQYHQTKGQAGETPDMEPAVRLMELYETWLKTRDASEQFEIWKEMIAIHARQQFMIGVVSSVRQPVVVSKRLRNVPEDATYSWEPGALFGIYRPDQFWFAS